MGAGAYNRGSAAIRQQLTAEQRDPIFTLMEELNRLPRYPDAGTPWAPIRILYDTAHGVWWIQDAVKGDRGFGSWYRDLRELCKRWQFTLTAYDATTHIWQGIPDDKPECHTLEACLYRHKG